MSPEQAQSIRVLVVDDTPGDRDLVVEQQHPRQPAYRLPQQQRPDELEQQHQLSGGVVVRFCSQERLIL